MQGCSATLGPSGLPSKPRTLGPGKGHQPQGALGSPGLSHAHRLWLSLGFSHRVASRHVNGHTRKWPSGWYRAGSPRLPVLTWPIYHTESDVHYGCPGSPTHGHYPGPALRVPGSWGCGRWPLAPQRRPHSLRPLGPQGAQGAPGRSVPWTFRAALPPNPRSLVGETGNIVPNH